MPDTNVDATLEMSNDITATTLEMSNDITATLVPEQGIQTQTDLVYLYNPETTEDVHHDDTLEGTGKASSPLKLSDELLNQIRRSGKTFVFEFDASQSEWLIRHNLNKKPSITVVDSADTVMTCAKDYIDTNTVKITFNAPFKGTAYLN